MFRMPACCLARLKLCMHLVTRKHSSSLEADAYLPPASQQALLPPVPTPCPQPPSLPTTPHRRRPVAKGWTKHTGSVVNYLRAYTDPALVNGTYLSPQIHHVVLPHLDPNTFYYYQVRTAVTARTVKFV